jgi:heptosyltransferase-3
MTGSLATELPARARILIISLRRIGDVLLATPLVRSLRRALPDASIDMLVFADSAGIVQSNPDIASIIAIPPQPSAMQTLLLAARLSRRYDLAVSTQTGDRPTFFAFAAGRRRAGLTGGEGTRLGRWLKRRALDASAPAVDNIHRVEQMLRLADVIGVARVPELVCPAATPPPGIPSGDYAVIHAAPKFAYKEWTRAGWRALAGELKRRGLTVIVIGGPGEAERRVLDDIWQGVAPVHQLPWPQTLALIAKARVYVGTDTSATHLAAATGCPTVALFGPMDPRVWGPWPVGGMAPQWAASGTIQNRGNVWIVQNPLPCLPCTLEGCERNIASRSVCLDELNPDEVLRAVDQALS